MTRHSYWYWESKISQESCEEIIAEAQKIGFIDGRVGQGNEVLNKNIRDCSIAWLPRMHTVESILAHHISAANQSTGWDLALTTCTDQVQIAKYNGDGQQFYNQHNDLMWYTDAMHLERKMSAVLMLSCPSTFEGGDLEIEGTPIPYKRQGTIVVFPSFIPHRVSPVTNGVRYSATCWVAGPRFK